MKILFDNKYHCILEHDIQKFLIEYKHDKGTLSKWNDTGGWREITFVFDSNGRESAIEKLKEIIPSFV